MEMRSDIIDLRIPAFGANLQASQPERWKIGNIRRLATFSTAALVLVGLVLTLKIPTFRWSGLTHPSLVIVSSSEQIKEITDVTVPAIQEALTVQAIPFDSSATAVTSAARSPHKGGNVPTMSLSARDSLPQASNKAVTSSLVTVHSLPVAMAVQDAEYEGADAVSDVDSLFQKRYREEVPARWHPGQDQHIPALTPLGTITEGRWTSAPEVYGHHYSLLQDICLPQCDRCRKSAIDWGCFQCTKQCDLPPSITAARQRLNFKIVSKAKEAFEMSQPTQEMKNAVRRMSIHRILPAKHVARTFYITKSGGSEQSRAFAGVSPLAAARVSSPRLQTYRPVEYRLPLQEFVPNEKTAFTAASYPKNTPVEQAISQPEQVPQSASSAIQSDMAVGSSVLQPQPQASGEYYAYTAVPQRSTIVQRGKARFIMGHTRKIKVLVPQPVIIPMEPSIPKLAPLKFFKKPDPHSKLFRNFDGQQMRVLRVVPESANVTIDINSEFDRETHSRLAAPRDQAIAGLLAAATANAYFDGGDRSITRYTEYGEVASAAGEPSPPSEASGGYPVLVAPDPFHLLPDGQLPVKAHEP